MGLLTPKNNKGDKKGKNKATNQESKFIKSPSKASNVARKQRVPGAKRGG
jgi:hypothetical protein